eukprot:355489-Chlamydomonas_euryale.AAC.19
MVARGRPQRDAPASCARAVSARQPSLLLALLAVALLLLRPAPQTRLGAQGACCGALSETARGAGSRRRRPVP